MSSQPTTYFHVTHADLTTYKNGPTHGELTDSPASTEGLAPLTHEEIWSVRELNILGGFLWLAVIITLIGNISCFYAVYKNLKKILEHPFFQSNVFCVLLSVVDVLLIILVGIPAAVFFTTVGTVGTVAPRPEGARELPRGAGIHDLGSSFYNLAVVEAILDYLVWLQLLIVVAICLDRAGHICRPLTYTFSIKARKTFAACFFCIITPFLLLTIPYIVVVNKTVSLNEQKVSDYDDREYADFYVRSRSYKCKYWAYNNATASDRILFMSCTVQTPKPEEWSEAVHFLRWETLAHPLVLALAVLSLLISNGLIIRKLFESAAFQKDNVKRQEEVAKSIRMNSIISTIQAVLLIICTLPMRVYQMEKRFMEWQECDTNTEDCFFDARKYSHHYILITKVLVFLGPMVNPWLYPIRMASIRSFLATKKRSVVSSARRFTVSSRAGRTKGSEYRSKHHKTEYVSLETEDRRNNGQHVPGQSKGYSRL